MWPPDTTTKSGRWITKCLRVPFAAPIYIPDGYSARHGLRQVSESMVRPHVATRYDHQIGPLDHQMLTSAVRRANLYPRWILRSAWPAASKRIHGAPSCGHPIRPPNRAAGSPNAYECRSPRQSISPMDTPLGMACGK